jgi:transcriptional regulator with GAF, ATPase, and Fis domain
MPLLWVGQESHGVVENFLDVLLMGLRLDLAYARIDDPRGGSVIEMSHADGHTHLGARTGEIGIALAPFLGTELQTAIPHPSDTGMLRISVVPLGVGGSGAFVAGSRRADFPNDFDTMVLEAAVNQARIWFRMARLQFERGRVEATLAVREDENAYLRKEVEVALAFEGVVGNSPALQNILSQIDLVAPTEAAVLLLGESGTGKELFAREIHARSRRRSRSLIKVNCAAIPREMFESEFFGHVRGAFTGAVRDRPGRFQLADLGTIFLDEIGDLPLDLQPKLLRVLQEGQLERVGDDKTLKVDVRVIAATNRDVAADVRAGRFREDLYYRLSVFPIDIPPLRGRAADIPLLALHFIALAAKELGMPPPVMGEEQAAALIAYDWPGNVRELQNVIERAVILSRGGELRIDHVMQSRGTDRRGPPTPAPLPPDDVVPADEWRRRERANIVAALARADGRVYGAGGAAELLGVKPSTLQSRLRVLGIKARERHKPPVP